ncbi:MAG TPA: hypothetical protein P5127_06115, partial [Oscillospiraceae bacterium]|nr:hypothetical protein [Oscillospiraceae bacterium]
MELMGVLTKFLSKRFDAGAKKMLKKSPTAPLPSGVFDRTSTAKSEFFTAGFGKTEVMPPDIDKKKYYVAGYRPWNPAQGVLDPMTASAIWLDDNSGKGGVVFV